MGCHINLWHTSLGLPPLCAELLRTDSGLVGSGILELLPWPLVCRVVYWGLGPAPSCWLPPAWCCAGIECGNLLVFFTDWLRKLCIWWLRLCCKWYLVGFCRRVCTWREKYTEIWVKSFWRSRTHYCKLKTSVHHTHDIRISMRRNKFYKSFMVTSGHILIDLNCDLRVS